MNSRAPLAYSGESGKLQCASCGNLFELEDLNAMQESGEKSSIKFDVPDEILEKPGKLTGRR